MHRLLVCTYFNFKSVHVLLNKDTHPFFHSNVYEETIFMRIIYTDIRVELLSVFKQSNSV